MRLARQVELVLHDGNQLAPPKAITTGSGASFRIYTPFWRALCRHMPPGEPLPAPDAIPTPAAWPQGDRLEDWALLPKHPDWAQGFADWQPGEAGAQARIAAFRDEAACYEENRNLPSREGTSRLSPHLHFGEVSPGQVWHGAAAAGGSVDVFLGEVGWRDYAQGIIRQFPAYGRDNARAAFNDMPWRTGPEAQADLEAWQQGRPRFL